MVKVMWGAANAGAAVPIEAAVSVPATARDPRRRLTFIVRDPPLADSLTGDQFCSSMLLLRYLEISASRPLLHRSTRNRARRRDELGAGNQALAGGSLGRARAHREHRLRGLG